MNFEVCTNPGFYKTLFWLIFNRLGRDLLNAILSGILTF